MSDNPDYVTLMRHACTPSLWLCAVMTWNHADESYGIRTCSHPNPRHVAVTLARKWAAERQIELILPQ